MTVDWDAKLEELHAALKDPHALLKRARTAEFRVKELEMRIAYAVDVLAHFHDTEHARKCALAALGAL